MSQKPRTRNRRQQLASFFGSRHRVPKEGVAQGRRSESSGPTPVAAHAFSGRFLIVVAVLVFIAIAAYAPLSSFFKQQAEINQVREHIAQLEGENQDLKTQLSWWQDDNFVKQQAKSRLYYVTEGETPYLVTGTDFTSGLADDTSAAAQTAPEQSWTNNLWDSFQESSLEDK